MKHVMAIVSSLGYVLTAFNACPIVWEVKPFWSVMVGLACMLAVLQVLANTYGADE